MQLVWFISKSWGSWCYYSVLSFQVKALCVCLCEADSSSDAFKRKCLDVWQQNNAVDGHRWQDGNPVGNPLLAFVYCEVFDVEEAVVFDATTRTFKIISKPKITFDRLVMTEMKVSHCAQSFGLVLQRMGCE